MPNQEKATEEEVPVKHAPLTQKKKWQDHRVIAWLLENGAVVSLCLLRKKALWKPKPKQIVSSALLNIFGSMLTTEGSILIQYLYVTRLYKHIPYFSKSQTQTEDSRNWKQIFKDWLGCNWPVYAIAGPFTAWMDTRLPKAARQELSNHPFKFWSFLKRLFIMRLVVDILFYVGHRALHSPWLYKYIHKRHHEHRKTTITTNFHFTVADLTIEAFIPFFIGLQVLYSFGFKSSRFDIALMITYMNWYEIGSHSGKPVPTVTYFPPLAPLYNTLLGDVDKRNVEFHERHHNRLNQNYGITQWLDWLLGTHKIQPQSEIDRTTKQKC